MRSLAVESHLANRPLFVKSGYTAFAKSAPISAGNPGTPRLSGRGDWRQLRDLAGHPVVVENSQEFPQLLVVCGLGMIKTGAKAVGLFDIARVIRRGKDDHGDGCPLGIAL